MVKNPFDEALFPRGFFLLTCLVPTQTIISAITHPPPIQIDRGDTFGGSIGSGKSSTKSCIDTGDEVVRFGDLLRVALIIFCTAHLQKDRIGLQKEFWLKAGTRIQVEEILVMIKLPKFIKCVGGNYPF